jgi:hypothetical protein
VITTTTNGPTDEQIEAAILAALEPTGDELMSWAVIQRQVPGCFWCKATALLRLHEEGKVYHVKIAGRPYVGLGDDADAELARRARAQGRLRGVRVA